MSSPSSQPRITDDLKFAPNSRRRRQSLLSFSSGDSWKNSSQITDGAQRQGLQLPPNENCHLSESSVFSNSKSITDDGTSEFEYSEDFVESVEEEETNAPKNCHKRVTWLTKEEEMEIVKQVNDQLKQEFKRIRDETREKQDALRKRFKTIISNSRSLLINARLNAEKITVNKLEATALKKQEEIEKRRALRTMKVLESGSSSDKLHNFGAGEDWLKQQIDEMASLRKIQADLDRARARKKANSSLTVGLGKGKLKVSSMLNSEVKRLEKAEQVHKLVLELKSLDLREEACELMQSLKLKESSEIELRARLYNENLKARLKATRRKEQEIARLRRERIADKERLEQERKEQEERKIRERKMAALKRKARNMEFQKHFQESMLNTQKSRSFTYSLFPKL